MVNYSNIHMQHDYTSITQVSLSSVASTLTDWRRSLSMLRAFLREASRVLPDDFCPGKIDRNMDELSMKNIEKQDILSSCAE